MDYDTALDVMAKHYSVGRVHKASLRSGKLKRNRSFPAPLLASHKETKWSVELL